MDVSKTSKVKKIYIYRFACEKIIALSSFSVSIQTAKTTTSLSAMNEFTKT